jgi:hypothetical protein
VKIAALALPLLLLSSPAFAEKKVAVEGSMLKVPDLWVEQTEIAEKAKAATLQSGGLDAWAVAWGSPQTDPLTLALHVRTHETIKKTMAEEFDDFHTGLKSTMEQGGATFQSYERSNSATLSVSRFEATQSGVKVLGVAFAGVETDGHLDGWTVECIYNDASNAADCAKVVKDYAVTRAASYFRPLEGGKPLAPEPKRKHK